MAVDVTDRIVDAPAGLRKTVDIMQRKNKHLTVENEVLVRMVLMQRLKDGDFDFTDGDYILDNYRPHMEDPYTYTERFTTDAITEWLAGRDR